MIRLATLPQDFPQIAAIRYRVFQVEQGVDPALEFDGQDDVAQHFLAYWEQAAVGTARLRSLSPKTVKLERVAVLSEFRGLGIGRRLMEYILNFLTNQGWEEVMMHAQEPVIAFYQKLGFVPEGDLFKEAGIPHRTMRKLLRSLG